MLTLDYRLSPGWRSGAAGTDMSHISTEALHYELFLGDVIFRSDEADFSAPWDWVPVLDFAMSLLRLSNELRTSGHQQFEFTESDATLDFERQGDQVTISSNYGPGSILVSFEDLHRAVGDFARRLVAELAAEFPKVAQAQAFQQCQKEVLSLPD